MEENVGTNLLIFLHICKHVKRKRLVLVQTDRLKISIKTVKLQPQRLSSKNFLAEFFLLIFVLVFPPSLQGPLQELLCNTYSLISQIYDTIYMVTIIAVIINRNVWIKFTISFSVGTLITHIIKVYRISVFQHGSSNPVRDSSQKNVFIYQRKPIPNQNLNSGPLEKKLQATCSTFLTTLIEPPNLSSKT